jgi:DNA-binding CsgD family transcriptional regulator
VNRLHLATSILEEAVFEPESLPEALGEAGRAIGFDHFCLVHSDLERPTFLGSEASLVFLNEYAHDGWLAHDYRINFVNRTANDTVFSEDAMVEETVRTSSAIYNDFFVKHGIETFAGWRHAIGDQTWVFSLARSRDKGPVTPEEIALLDTFRSTANRTARLAHKLAQTHLEGMMDGLSLKGAAAILLDKDGEVITVNASAERLFDGEFDVRQNRLWAHHPNSRAALAALSSSVDGGHPTQSSFIVIHRRSPRRPLLATPHPVEGVALDVLTGARTLLVITCLDDEAHTGSAAASLRRLFNLSPAESEIASLLANGLTLQTIAETRGVGRETVRAQVKRVFDKLDVRRQADVVRIVERLRAPVALSGPKEG